MTSKKTLFFAAFLAFFFNLITLLPSILEYKRHTQPKNVVYYQAF